MALQFFSALPTIIFFNQNPRHYVIIGNTEFIIRNS